MYQSTPTFDIHFSGDASVPATATIQQESNFITMSGDSIRGNETFPNLANFNDCRGFLTENNSNITHPTSESPIRIVIASVTLLENAVVILALLYSWKRLQQNIYIFALSIAISDGLLGFIHVTNAIIVGITTANGTHAEKQALDQMGSTSWFYLIRGATLLIAQVASTGNAACLVIAFKRYVYALAPSGYASSSPSTKRNGASSKLLSRRTCYVMTSTVWIVSVLIGGFIPLIWNCGEECACFVEAGVHQSDTHAMKCFEDHGCSYIFPPIKSGSYLMCLGLFFLTLSVLVGTCIQVIMAAGGIVALLPYRLHKYYVRRKKSLDVDVNESNLPTRLRSHSVQMTYMRDMMHFMISISLTFVICKLPAALLLLVESVTNHPLVMPKHLGQFLILLSYFGSILNPVIFAITLHGMKEALKKLVKPCCTTTISVTIGKQLHSSENAGPQQHSTPV